MSEGASVRAAKLGLVIDLDTCVGCHACATACKSWNGASAISGPLTDSDPYGAGWLFKLRIKDVHDLEAVQEPALYREQIGA